MQFCKLCGTIEAGEKNRLNPHKGRTTRLQKGKPMEISILAEFVKLVETCSFQQTAELMNLSQSALTKHIHKLEEELNITMFDRSQRSVQLNEYSQRFYPYARQILAAYNEGVAALQEMNAQEEGSITIAYDPLLGQYGVVNILADFSLNYPQHSLSAVESYRAAEMIANKKCDFAFVSEADAEDTPFSKMIFRTDHLAVVMKKDHPLANSSSVTLSQLANERFVLHSNHVSTPHDETRKFMEICAQQNFQPNVVAESHFTSTVLHYVQKGMGIAVLNRMHIPDTSTATDLVLVDISPTVRTYLYMLYPRRVTSHSAKDFLHYMVECCSQ